MRRTAIEAVAAGTAAGATIVALATAGHAIAGGTVSLASLVVPTAVVLLVTALLSTRVRWSPGTTLALAALAQPLLHIALGSGSGHAVHAEHAHHAMQQSAGSGSVSVSMAGMHAVVAVVATAAVTWGVRWLRTMPALLRAMLVGVEQWCAALQATALVIRPCMVAGMPSVVLASRSSRGPPE